MMSYAKYLCAICSNQILNYTILSFQEIIVSEGNFDNWSCLPLGMGVIIICGISALKNIELEGIFIEGILAFKCVFIGVFIEESFV